MGTDPCLELERICSGNWIYDFPFLPLSIRCDDLLGEHFSGLGETVCPERIPVHYQHHQWGPFRKNSRSVSACSHQCVSSRGKQNICHPLRQYRCFMHHWSIRADHVAIERYQRRGSVYPRGVNWKNYPPSYRFTLHPVWRFVNIYLSYCFHLFYSYCCYISKQKHDIKKDHRCFDRITASPGLGLAPSQFLFFWFHCRK